MIHNKQNEERRDEKWDRKEVKDSQSKEEIP